MSQENVEVVKRANAALNTGDTAAMREVLDPDVVLEDRMHAPGDPPTVRGRDAVLGIVADWQETFGKYEAEIEEYVDTGNWVVCVTHYRGTGAAGQTPVEIRVADAYEVREGRVVRAHLSYESREDALEAVGLSE